LSLGRFNKSEADTSDEQLLNSNAGQALVLLSGGIDSAAALALALAEGFTAEALFVDYGQAAAEAERSASRAIANHFGIAWRELNVAGHAFTTGEIRGRNAFLLHSALLVLEWRAALVFIGIHAGTRYRDCDPLFVELVQHSFDYHSGGTVRIAAPFLEWSKLEVYDYAGTTGLPLNLTHSCEAGSAPCGSCRSCLDRRLLDVPA
jgi:7-cyano-7-deazaguanine synthase